MTSTLDCQQCGRVICELSPAEAQQVADKPYDYILYCYQCQKDWR